MSVEQTLSNLVRESQGQPTAAGGSSLKHAQSIATSTTIDPGNGADADRAVVFATDGETGFFGSSMSKSEGESSRHLTLSVQVPHRISRWSNNSLRQPRIGLGTIMWLDS